MNTDKTNEPQPKQHGTGSEKPLPESGEVAGRKQSTFTCFNCGVLNYYDPCWHAHACWRCGELNTP